ncbi:MAG: methyltransferase domain-containing protein [Chloroflexi bacterium]|nr:methyltransferase domain-containing protein [Chloroflexota bacterium]
MELLICPVCGAQLAQVDNTLKCPQAHSFDIAREGYVNLLLAGRKQPKILGDTKDMLRARRTFLAQGFYDPLSNAINEQVCAHLANQRHNDAPSPTCIVDVGCGEGYYLGRLKNHLDGQLEHDNVCYFGIDISKEATKLAAKRHKEMRFVVANVNQKLLFPDHAVHVLTNIFAPRNAAEFDRVIIPDGLLLIVIPGPRHLTSLSEQNLFSLSIEPNKQKNTVERLAGTFTQTGEQIVKYEIHLDNKALVNLIQMTPNYWHSSSEIWNNVKTIESVQTEVNFIILAFNR